MLPTFISNLEVKATHDCEYGGASICDSTFGSQPPGNETCAARISSDGKTECQQTGSGELPTFNCCTPHTSTFCEPLAYDPRCTDGNPCTFDICNGSGTACTYVNVSSGSVCERDGTTFEPTKCCNGYGSCNQSCGGGSTPAPTTSPTPAPTPPPGGSCDVVTYPECTGNYCESRVVQRNADCSYTTISTQCDEACGSAGCCNGDGDRYRCDADNRCVFDSSGSYTDATCSFQCGSVQVGGCGSCDCGHPGECELQADGSCVWNPGKCGPPDGCDLGWSACGGDSEHLCNWDSRYFYCEDACKPDSNCWCSNNRNRADQSQNGAACNFGGNSSQSNLSAQSCPYSPTFCPGESSPNLIVSFWTGFNDGSPLYPGPLRRQRLDGDGINEDWQGAPPDSGIACDATYIASWEGYVKAVGGTGTYTFKIDGYHSYESDGDLVEEFGVDDGAMLWVGSFPTDTQVNNCYTNGFPGGSCNALAGGWRLNCDEDQGTNCPSRYEGSITLTAGQWYPIRLDFMNVDRAGTIQLKYAGPGFGEQIIPASSFTCQTPSPPSGTISGDSVITINNSGNWSGEVKFQTSDNDGGYAQLWLAKEGATTTTAAEDCVRGWSYFSSSNQWWCNITYGTESNGDANARTVYPRESGGSGGITSLPSAFTFSQLDTYWIALNVSSNQTAWDADPTRNCTGNPSFDFPGGLGTKSSSGLSAQDCDTDPTHTASGSDQDHKVVTVTTPAWIQTLEGDVHSNVKIDVKGGP